MLTVSIKVGGIVGASVSALFLLILGIANAYILFLLLRQMRALLSERVPAESMELRMDGNGIIFKMCRKLFRLIDR